MPHSLALCILIIITICRNNLLASSIESLNLTPTQTRSLLSSPHNYLSKLSPDKAAHVRSVLIPAYQNGFRIIFAVGAALAAAAFFLAAGLMPQVGLKRKDDAALKEEGKTWARGGAGNGNSDVERGKRKK